jgi:hypothetical protein
MTSPTSLYNQVKDTLDRIADPKLGYDAQIECFYYFDDRPIDSSRLCLLPDDYAQAIIEHHLMSWLDENILWQMDSSDNGTLVGIKVWTSGDPERKVFNSRLSALIYAVNKVLEDKDGKA